MRMPASATVLVQQDGVFRVAGKVASAAPEGSLEEEERAKEPFV